MQIVFKKEVAETLREKYTVLELETITTATGQTIDAYCVVPLESVVLEIATLQESTDKHQELIDAIKADNVDACVTIAKELLGKFGREVDTFYQTIIDRCLSTGTAKLSIPQVSPED